MSNDDLIVSLTAAVAAAPADHALRLHLARLLVDAGRAPEAMPHVATVLATDPTRADALELMRTLTAGPAAGTEPEPTPDASPEPTPDPTPEPTPQSGFDWSRAEEQFSDVVPPRFATTEEEPVTGDAWDVEHAGIRLADVGGMTQVKEQLDAAFLAPLRNPELRRLYGASLRGGLVLYGPPGCGKTFLARALAGEMGANFLTASLADLLDMYIGNSEQNLHELFGQVRRNRPCVLFLDELDAIGQKRTQARNTVMRTTINQLLIELDGVSSDNEGVYVLAATNQPWDVDPALLRPGRFDRLCYVGPPDRDARQAILDFHLRRRPLERIDLHRLARVTENFSGADLAYLCDSAARRALMESSRTGAVRMIGMGDFEAVLAEISPSTNTWFDVAANVVAYANQSGQYDELARDLRRRRRR